MKNIIKYIKKNYLILLLVAAGLFLRLFKYEELFNYSHDQDLLGWFIRDVLENHHIRLIGQETSTQGIFIGPYFYYLLIPFYLITRMDPIGGVFAVALIGAVSIFSFYFIFSKIFGKRTGLIAAAIYTFSFYTIFNDREVVPTMPVILWSAWFFYDLILITKAKFKPGFLLLGLLTALIWNLNMALIILLPMVPISLFFAKKHLNWKYVVNGLIVLFLLSLPLILFEGRHHFQQTHSLISSLTTNQKDIVSGLDKLKRVILLSNKNLAGLLWRSAIDIPDVLAFWLMFLSFVFLTFKKIIKPKLGIIMFSWIVIYIGFFSVYSKIVSEYYLNGMIVIWIAILSLILSYISEKLPLLFLAILISFIGINMIRFFTIPINRSGYVEKKELIAEIKKNASLHNYPCVSVSYITKPGYDLGYRYLFWLAKIHVNHPNSGSPVYSIVFPQKPIFKTNIDFGALGLIYPDYNRYTKEEVTKSCSGEDSNLTDPLFGFSQ